jgi:hypothetical protein
MHTNAGCGVDPGDEVVHPQHCGRKDLTHGTNNVVLKHLLVIIACMWHQLNSRVHVPATQSAARCQRKPGQTGTCRVSAGTT